MYLTTRIAGLFPYFLSFHFRLTFFFCNTELTHLKITFLFLPHKYFRLHPFHWIHNKSYSHCTFLNIVRDQLGSDTCVFFFQIQVSPAYFILLLISPYLILHPTQKKLHIFPPSVIAHYALCSLQSSIKYNCSISTNCPLRAWLKHSSNIPHTLAYYERNSSCQKHQLAQNGRG